MSILQNANYMKRFIHHPCATPNPLIMIEAALEVGPLILFELLSADVMDKVIKSTKQMNRTRAGTPHKPAGFWQDDKPPPRSHGRRLRGKGGRRSSGIRVSQKEYIFELVDMEQTGMFWWMAADLATEFMARWTTMVYLKAGCPFDHSCFGEGPLLSIYIGQGTNDLILPRLDTGTLISGGLRIQVVKQGAYSISYHGALAVHPTGAAPTAARLELVGGMGGGRIWQDGAGGGLNEAGQKMSGGFYHFDTTKDHPSYWLRLVNEHPTETVGVVSGMLRLSSGFCDNHAPRVPFDMNHMLPHR